VKHSSALFRRAPFVVAYWQGDRLLFHNYATGRDVSADPDASRLLHVFSRWRSAESAAAELAEFSAGSVRRAIGNLHRSSLLWRQNDRPSAANSGLEAWERNGWNPAAGFLHLSTKDVAYSEEPSDSRNHAGRSSIPAAVKRIPRAPRTRLPPVAANGEFVETLLARRTWRQFARRPLRLDDLSALLDLTFGIQQWLPVDGGKVPLKTAPSGGARHPVEAYVAVRHVMGVKPGLYHYSSDRHELERLTRHIAPRRFDQYLPTQYWFNAASALVFMTAVFPRVQSRYKFARAYRVVLAEAGHLCQTFCLTATRLGLAPFCTMALADSLIERDLGIDGVSESVLYSCGVGVRPPGVDRAPWPVEPKKRVRLSSRAPRRR